MKTRDVKDSVFEYVGTTKKVCIPRRCDFIRQRIARQVDPLDRQCRSGLDRLWHDEDRHGAVGEVNAVWGDVAALQRPDMNEVLVADRGAGGAQLGDDALDLQGVPQHDGVGQQAEATGLVHDYLEIGGAELALIGEEQPPGQVVAGLAAVKLSLAQLPQCVKK